MPAITISSVNTGTDEITAVAHGLLTGDRFRLRNVGGALPAATPALAGATDYFALRTGVDTLKVSDTNAHALAGTNIVNLTGSGSGTTTVEYGLPYAIPNVIAAPGVQVKSADLNGTWNSLVALYDLLTGQAQSIWSTIVVALTVTFNALVTFAAGATAAANQHFTVSGTGKYKHGTVTQQLPFTTPGTAASVNSVNFSSGTGSVYVTPIALPIGKRILKVRAFAFDSATGPTKFVVGLRVIDSGGSSTLTNSGSQSAGSGSLQTIESAAMTTTVTSGTRYWAEAQIQTGAANCAMQGFEVDYDQP